MVVKPIVEPDPWPPSVGHVYRGSTLASKVYKGDRLVFADGVPDFGYDVIQTAPQCFFRCAHSSGDPVNEIALSPATATNRASQEYNLGPLVPSDPNADSCGSCSERSGVHIELNESRTEDWSIMFAFESCGGSFGDSDVITCKRTHVIHDETKVYFSGGNVYARVADGAAVDAGPIPSGPALYIFCQDRDVGWTLDINGVEVATGVRDVASWGSSDGWWFGDGFGGATKYGKRSEFACWLRTLTVQERSDISYAWAGE